MDSGDIVNGWVHHRPFIAQLQKCSRIALVSLAVGATDLARAQLTQPQLDSRRDEALASIARRRPTSRWIELNTNELAALEQKAARYHSECASRHSPDGLVISLRYFDDAHTALDR